MSLTTQITVSIVLYQEKKEEVFKVLDSCLSSSLISAIFLIDNSPTETQDYKNYHPKISYLKTKTNLGFAKGNNLILKKLENNSDFHLILNPDVFFDHNILDNLLIPFKKYGSLSLIAPKILYPNNTIQISSRKHPSLKRILIRTLSKKRSKNYISNPTSIKNCYETEFLHGAFLLFKTEDFLKLNGFDDRYFLYLEDADICRELQVRGRKVFYHQGEKVYHHLKRSSSKNFTLFVIHFVSFLKYFTKWGF